MPGSTSSGALFLGRMAGKGKDMTKNIDLADAIENRTSFCIGALDMIYTMLIADAPLPDETDWILIETLDKLRGIRAIALKELGGYDMEATEPKPAQDSPGGCLFPTMIG
ncbi:MAG: hypothetical protein DRH17_03300 [Deltaproteobacteria bacterium]|nr:MAG: hypothetical protein DRH17_03300 [Deltaproteobacteria bacterium]